LKKLIIPISLGVICLSFSLLPANETNPETYNSAPVEITTGPSDSVRTTVEIISSLYNTLHLNDYGLSDEAFFYAWKGYQRLLELKKIAKTGLLSICDFSQSSKHKRFYVIDIENKKVIINTYVAHGRNSGGEYATKFSNRPESLQSSLGFYITTKTYTGSHGLSLKIIGVDRGFNDKALNRNIVIHGSEYVGADRVRSGATMGRSWGCPAVPKKESSKIIKAIKNGSCFFIYHPGKNYLLGSKILNG
jgi:hypothetical protein